MLPMLIWNPFAFKMIDWSRKQHDYRAKKDAEEKTTQFSFEV